MATPEDLRAFDAKKAEVNMGIPLFMMSLDLSASHVLYVYRQDVYKQD